MSSAVPFMSGRNDKQMDDLVIRKLSPSTLAEIDRELTPILADLTTLDFGNDQQHPAVQYLYKWCTDPQTTIEEFIYVVWTLGERVEEVMEDHFDKYISKESNDYFMDRNDAIEDHFEEFTGDHYSRCSLYLAKIAAEALAARNPNLEGLWELTAYYVIRLVKLYNFIGFVSNHLIEWVFNMCCDAKLCPNIFLRTEFLGLLPSLTNATSRHGNYYGDYRPNQNRALDALINALNQNNLRNIESNEDMCLYLNTIPMMLSAFIGDYELAHDRLNPTSVTVPMGVHVLTNLFRTIAEYVHLELIKFRQNHEFPNSLYALSRVFRKTTTVFLHCCNMEQLVPQTTSCIMTLFESVLPIMAAGVPDPKGKLQNTLWNIHHSMERLRLKDHPSFYVGPI